MRIPIRVTAAAAVAAAASPAFASASSPASVGQHSASQAAGAVFVQTEGNQRVLLHRGRSRLRQLFEDEFREVR